MATLLLQKWNIVAAIVVIVVALSACAFWITQKLPDGLVRVAYCDVGQGDGVLITHKYSQLLIDAGPDKKILDCLAQLMPFGDSHLEVIIATHPDHDHIGGFAAVFERYSVSHIFTLGVTKDTNGFDAFRSGIVEKVAQGARLTIPRSGQILQLSSLVSLEFLYPLEEIGDSQIFSSSFSRDGVKKQAALDAKRHLSFNDLSISIRVRVGKFSHLLTGDLEGKGERALLSSRELPQVTVLKAGHHGSQTSTSKQLLQKVAPQFLVISSGRTNRYGHPHQRVLDDAQLLSISVLRTDELGTVIWKSDGKVAQWEQ